MKNKWLVVFVLMAFLVACGSGSDGSDDLQMAEEALEPLEVEILTESDAFAPGEEGKLEAQVTKGDENVADADEVQFEIWKKGHQDDSEHIDAENEGDGLYTLSHTFAEDGIYYVIAHVTARGSHTMPKKEFIVGDVAEEELADDANGEDHYHTEDFSIHLVKPDILEAETEAEWIVHIEKDGLPFTDADVRLEFWKTDDEKHHFVDALENNEGEYKAEWTFAEGGEHNVQIHVEKDDLHEHIERTFQVE